MMFFFIPFLFCLVQSSNAFSKGSIKSYHRSFSSHLAIMKLFTKNKDEPSETEKKPLEQQKSWNFEKQSEWPQICLDGSHQSPIKLLGSQSYGVNPKEFDIIPNPQSQEVEFQIKDGSLILDGEFINFSTLRINESDGRLIKRFYRNSRAEIKIPCEHTKEAKVCAMEIQFYATEEHDYTRGYPLENIPNVAFSLMFQQDDVDPNLFTNGWTLNKKEFLIQLQQDKSKKNSKFQFDIMKALESAKVLPSTLFKHEPNVFHYHGSYTKPPCNENLYWFIHKTYLPVNPLTIKMLKNLYLSQDKKMFPDRVNARTKHSTQNFKTISLSLSSIKGQELNTPQFVNRDLMNPEECIGNNINLINYEKQLIRFKKKQQQMVNSSQDNYVECQQEMLSRSPVIGTKSVVLYKDQIHVYNAETKDHLQQKTLTKNLLITSANFFFGNTGVSLYIYEFRQRDLKPKIVTMNFEPEIFQISNELNNKIQYVVYSQGDEFVVQEINGEQKVVFQDSMNHEITSMRFSDDNKHFYVGNSKGKVYEYNASNFAKNEQPRKIKVFRGYAVHDLIISKPNMVAMNKGGKMAFINIETPCPNSQIVIENRMSIIALQKISDSQVLSIHAEKLRLWDFESKRALKSISLQEGQHLLFHKAQFFNIKDSVHDHRIQQVNLQIKEEIIEEEEESSDNSEDSQSNKLTKINKQSDQMSQDVSKIERKEKIKGGPKSRNPHRIYYPDLDLNSEKKGKLKNLDIEMDLPDDQENEEEKESPDDIAKEDVEQAEQAKKDSNDAKEKAKIAEVSFKKVLKDLEKIEENLKKSQGTMKKNQISLNDQGNEKMEQVSNQIGLMNTELQMLKQSAKEKEETAKTAENEYKNKAKQSLIKEEIAEKALKNVQETAKEFEGAENDTINICFSKENHCSKLIEQLFNFSANLRKKGIQFSCSKAKKLASEQEKNDLCSTEKQGFKESIPNNIICNHNQTKCYVKFSKYQTFECGKMVEEKKKIKEQQQKKTGQNLGTCIPNEYTILMENGKYLVKLVTNYFDKKDIKINKLIVNGVIFYGKKSKSITQIEQKLVEVTEGKLVISDDFEPSDRKIFYPKLSYIMIKQEETNDKALLTKQMIAHEKSGDVKKLLINHLEELKKNARFLQKSKKRFRSYPIKKEN